MEPITDDPSLRKIKMFFVEMNSDYCVSIELRLKKSF